MSEQEARSIAVRIAERLFINGQGEEANRLVLELPGKRWDGSARDGGGWCQGAVIDQIAAVLVEEGNQ